MCKSDSVRKDRHGSGAEAGAVFFTSTGVFAMEDLPSMSMVACHLGRHTLHAQVRGRIDADQTSGRRAGWLTHSRTCGDNSHDRVSSPDPFERADQFQADSESGNAASATRKAESEGGQ